MLTPDAEGQIFAEDLTAWRKRMGLSRDEAAQALGVNKSTMIGWIAGRPCVLEGMARKLMGLLESERGAPQKKCKIPLDKR